LWGESLEERVLENRRALRSVRAIAKVLQRNAGMNRVGKGKDREREDSFRRSLRIFRLFSPRSLWTSDNRERLAKYNLERKRESRMKRNAISKFNKSSFRYFYKSTEFPSFTSSCSPNRRSRRRTCQSSRVVRQGRFRVQWQG